MTWPARLRALFRSSFLSRALVGTLSGVTLSIFLVTLVFVLISRSEFRTQLHLRAASIADFAATQCEFPMLVGDQEALQRIAQTVLANDDVLFVVVSEGSGRRLVTSMRPGMRPEEVTASPVSSVTLQASRVTVLEMSRGIAAPVSERLVDWEAHKGSTPPIGAVRIGFSMATQQRLFLRAISSGTGIALITLMVVTGVYVLLLRRMVQPLKALSEFAKDVGDGDLSRRTEPEGEDEVAQVARAFNQMVEKLGVTMVSKSYVEDIIRSMAESLMVVDAHGAIRTVNEATCALVGYDDRELIGLPAGAIVSGDGPERTYRAKNGSRIPVMFSSAPLREDRAEVWIAQDITEVKRAQQELLAAKEAAEEASRAKTLFLATMSHELRTPLNAIIGYAEMLEEVAAERAQPDMGGDLQKILKASRHLLNLLNDVLAMAKLEAGRMELHVTEFELDDVVSDIVNTVRPLAARNGSEIEVLSEGGGGVLITDERKFRQSLLNLMSNACKFTHGGKVSLAISREMLDQVECVKLDVRDTGIGIAPEHLGKLFQAFSQADASHSRKYGGTGLGLAISRRLCETMGGNISVESEPGKGSVFTMRVPAKAG